MYILVVSPLSKECIKINQQNLPFWASVEDRTWSSAQMAVKRDTVKILSFVGEASKAAKCVPLGFGRVMPT